jgi:hypothetical protein
VAGCVRSEQSPRPRRHGDCDRSRERAALLCRRRWRTLQPAQVVQYSVGPQAGRACAVGASGQLIRQGLSGWPTTRLDQVSAGRLRRVTRADERAPVAARAGATDRMIAGIEKVGGPQVLVASGVVRVEAICVDRQLDRRMPGQVERAVIALEAALDRLQATATTTRPRTARPSHTAQAPQSRPWRRRPTPAGYEDPVHARQGPGCRSPWPADSYVPGPG